MVMEKEIFAKRHVALKQVNPKKITAENSLKTRSYQGIPGIAIISEKLMFATWYGGGSGEGPDNYVILSVSYDCGYNWQEIMTISPPGLIRAFDAVLWINPQGHLCWFWAQSYSPKLWEIFDGKCGVWFSRCEHPDVDVQNWTEPVRIADGIMMNKPIIDASGNWLLPTALWQCGKNYISPEDMNIAYSNVTISRDNGESFQLLGSADVPNRSFDEHQLVELKDGKLWMLVRCYYGIGQSFSCDGGKTWSPGRKTKLGGPNSKFAIQRLKSGRLLLINHKENEIIGHEIAVPEMRSRTNLCAWLSDDDGENWYGEMLLDAKDDVAYPDFTQAPDGRIYVIYDHARYTLGEIKLACITEADVAHGRITTPGSFLNGIISSAIA